MTVKEVLDERRVLIYGRADEERVVELADSLRDVRLRSGDALVLDLRSNLLTEKLVRQEAEELVLEEVPDISYADVGGLDAQIESITDAVELPYLHRALFQDYELPAPKGILLYGPPGCGKTLIAKAVANSLSAKVGRAERQSQRALVLPEHQGSRAAQQVRRRDRAPDPRSSSNGRARRPRRACRSSSSSTRWTRCFARAARASARTWSRRSCPSCSPRSTAWSRCATSS